MSITVNHQQPVDLTPWYRPTITGVYDPLQHVRDTILEPITTPMNTSQPVTMTDAQGNDVLPECENTLVSCLGDTVVPESEAKMKNILSQTLIHYPATVEHPVDRMFVTQAAHRLKLPEPTPRVIYTVVDDVIPAAKKLLATRDSAELLATLAYTFRPRACGVWFLNNDAFVAFTTWMSQYVHTLHAAHTLPLETRNLLTSFGSCTLNDLTEAFMLRRDDNDGNDELSFARIIMSCVMTYIEEEKKNQVKPTMGLLPWSVAELCNPRSLVCVNVEKHARTHHSDINKDWNALSHALIAPAQPLSARAVTKLGTLQRQARKMAQTAHQMQRMQQNTQLGKSADHLRIRTNRPSSPHVMRDLLKVLGAMKNVNRSHNVFRQTHTTLARANRRRPDDPNVPGTITSQKFRPDIHLYIDTSGSISEENYKDTVMFVIAVAKKLGVNMYVSSFSHKLSFETLLRVQGRSPRQIWKRFMQIPKVTGGTSYAHIWKYIQASPTRQKRLSLIVTDFDWLAPQDHIEHPRNLYYAPCSAIDWPTITSYAECFAQSMKHIDPTIMRRFLGMIQ